jgi:hypothetical protein
LSDFQRQEPEGPAQIFRGEGWAEAVYDAVMVMANDEPTLRARYPVVLGSLRTARGNLPGIMRLLLTEEYLNHPSAAVRKVAAALVADLAVTKGAPTELVVSRFLERLLRETDPLILVAMGAALARLGQAQAAAPRVLQRLHQEAAQREEPVQEMLIRIAVAFARADADQRPKVRAELVWLALYASSDLVRHEAAVGLERLLSHAPNLPLEKALTRTRGLSRQTKRAIKAALGRKDALTALRTLYGQAGPGGLSHLDDLVQDEFANVVVSTMRTTEEYQQARYEKMRRALIGSMPLMVSNRM